MQKKMNPNNMARPSNLADQFRASVSVPATPVAPVAAVAPPAPVVPVAQSSQVFVPAKPASKSTSTWLRDNWGKTVAILLIVVVTTIFIARTILVARNKKRARDEETKARQMQEQPEWDAFFDSPPAPPSRIQMPPPRVQMPPHMMPPQMMPPHMMPPHIPHMPMPMPGQMMPPQPVPMQGTTPLPQNPSPIVLPQMAPQIQQPQMAHSPHAPPQRAPPQQPTTGNGEVTRGMPQRMPPADNPYGGTAGSLIPEMTRPVRVSPMADGASFAVADAPVAASNDREEPRMKDVADAPQLPPADIGVNTPSSPTAETRL